jgi:hypothetical protein
VLGRLQHRLEEGAERNGTVARDNLCHLHRRPGPRADRHPVVVQSRLVRGTRFYLGKVVFLAIGPAAIAYLFYYRGLRSVSPVSATITLFSVPVFGSISSVLLLGESFTVVQLIGALITVAGALLAVIQTPSSRARSIGTSDSDTPQPHSEVRA